MTGRRLLVSGETRSTVFRRVGVPRYGGERPNFDNGSVGGGLGSTGSLRVESLSVTTVETPLCGESEGRGTLVVEVRRRRTGRVDSWILKGTGPGEPVGKVCGTGSTPRRDSRVFKVAEERSAVTGWGPRGRTGLPVPHPTLRQTRTWSAAAGVPYSRGHN